MSYKNLFKISKIKRLLLSHPECIILFITTLASLLYFTWGINSWKFSFVGDEWSFYAFAKEVAQKNFLTNPFSFNGVYGVISVLASLYQSIFLKLLGYSNFTWRFSNILLIIPITIFFFLWLKKSFNHRVALVSTLILQSSFYLANFFKIGYPHPLCFTLFIVCLYIAKSCSDNPTAKNFILLGLILGISFYVYIGPLFPFLTWPYLLPLLAKKHLNKELLLKIFLLGFSYILILAPALIDHTYLKGPAANTSFLKREFSNNFQMAVNVFHNFLLFYKNYDYLYNHFVAGPYLDIISRTLAFIGTIIVIVRSKKKEYLFLLLTYISTCLVIGLTSPYWYAPTTRGIFFLPFGFVFAGIALERIIKIFSSRITFLIIPLIFIINAYQSQIGVFKEAGYTATALVVKALQEEKGSASQKKIILLLPQDSNYTYHDMPTLKQAYKLEDIPFVVIKTKNIQCSSVAHGTVLLFDNYTETKDAMRDLDCPQSNNTSIKILSPKIFL